VFSEAALGAALHLPADAVIAGAEAAGAGEAVAGIWVGAGAAKLDRQDTAGAQQLFAAVTERFAGTKEAEEAGALLARMHQAAAFSRDRIGVLLPLTGFYQAAGERALNGIRTAVDAVNRDGNGPFRLLVLDTGSDPAGVAAAVRHLENSGAACIIGPMVTAAAAAMEAQALEIPMIALSQEPGITDAGPFVFRHFLTPEAQTEGLVSYVMAEAGYDRFAVFYPDDRYGHRFREAFLQAVDAQGGQVTVQAAYAPGQADFSSLIRPLIRGYQKLDLYRNFVDLAPGEPRDRQRIYRAKVNFDAVFIPDGPETGVQISQQLRFHDIRDVILLGTNIWKRKALDGAGNALLPVVFPVDFDPDSPEETVQTFVADYTEAFGEPPDYFAAAGFEAALQVMSHLSNPRVTSRTQLMQTLNFRDIILNFFVIE
jgi:branched-chain amino acid transport system substrate-binding protein